MNKLLVIISQENTDYNCKRSFIAILYFPTHLVTHIRSLAPVHVLLTDTKVGDLDVSVLVQQQILELRQEVGEVQQRRGRWRCSRGEVGGGAAEESEVEVQQRRVRWRCSRGE